MKTRQSLLHWVKVQHQRELQYTLAIGVTVAFLVCVVFGYQIQASGTLSLANMHTASIKNWVQNGDYLQLKFVTGKLMDSGAIDYIKINDMNGRLVLMNDPLEIDSVASSAGLRLKNGQLINLYCLNYDTNPQGSFCFGKRLELSWFMFIGITLLLFFLLILFVMKRQFHKLSNTLASQILTISKYAKMPTVEVSSQIEIQEVEDTINEIHAYAINEAISKQKIQEHEMASVVTALASQVSHDIRSPLAALEMMMPATTELPEEKRLIIRNAINRIRDIANSLLLKGAHQKLAQDSIAGTNLAQTLQNRTHYLIPIVEEMITEKRIQYREKINTSIEFEYSVDAYDAFIALDPVELKRVLSNLINNAVEALPAGSGKVRVLIRQNEQQNSLCIVVKDNGIGIPTHVLDKLGQKGETHGKTAGNGLGLFHAYEAAKSWGGSVKITSSDQEGAARGTLVQINIPRATPPEWFVAALNMTAK